MSRRLCDICHARPAASVLTLRRGELHREIEVCELHAALVESALDEAGLAGAVAVPSALLPTSAEDAQGGLRSASGHRADEAQGGLRSASGR